MLSDRYVAEFLEKYERLNLKGYNSGGCAYRESKAIFAKAEEEHRLMQHASMDVSMLAESVKVKGVDSSLARPSLMQRLSQAVGIKTQNAMRESQDPKLGEGGIEMLDEQGHI